MIDFNATIFPNKIGEIIRALFCVLYLTLKNFKMKKFISVMITLCAIILLNRFEGVAAQDDDGCVTEKVLSKLQKTT